MACGFSLGFEASLDWRGAYGVRIKLAAKSKNAYFRIYVRNALPQAQGGDVENTQYNQMLLPTDETNHPADITFNEFILADWWLASHQVPSQYNVAQFDRVTSFDVELFNPSVLGDHEVQILELALLRPYITARACYLSVLGLWMVLLVVFSVHRLRLRHLLTQQVQANLETMRFAVAEFEDREPPFCEIPQDDLTGIYNRQGFIDYWTQASRFWAADDSMALLVVQVDDMAAVEQGADKRSKDSALLAVVNGLKSHVRPQDKLARWHEGQFILLCPLTLHPEAIGLAEKLRNHIHLIRYDATQPNAVSATIGVVLFNAGEPLERAYARYQVVVDAQPPGSNRVIDCGGSQLE